MPRRTILVLAALLLWRAPLLAQGPSCTTNGCTITNTASATVGDILKLSLNTATPTDLGTPVTADFDAGYMDASGPTATVKANRPWSVAVVGAAANFTYAGALTDPNKPATDLQWGTAAGTYGHDMESSAVLFSGATGTSSASQQVFYRTAFAYDKDVPGTYSLVVNFTLSAP